MAPERVPHMSLPVFAFLALCSTMMRCCSLDDLSRNLVAHHSLIQGGSASSSPLSFGASGDLMFDTSMMSAAFSSPRTYKSQLADKVLKLISYPSIFYANLEGTSATGLNGKWKHVKDPGMVTGDVYSWLKNSINNHPKLAADLALAGVDVVSLSNNHCMDRGPVGVKRTIDACKAGGLLHFGTRRSGSTCEGWYTIVQRDGWNVAWVGCTDVVRSKHGHSKTSDHHHQVLFCRSPDFLPLIHLLSRQPAIDAVIVTVHWGGREDKAHSHKGGSHHSSRRGTCYSAEVTASMRGFAKAIVDAGAATVLGTHPHVLMEWETYASSGRRALIAYSLGNLISRQGSEAGSGRPGSSLYNCQRRTGLSARECRHRLQSHAVIFFNMTKTQKGPSVSCFSYVETATNKKRMMEQVANSMDKETHAKDVLGSKWRTSPEQMTCFPFDLALDEKTVRKRSGRLHG